MIFWILSLSNLLYLVSSASLDEWKGRSIYQLLTDRFSRGDDKYWEFHEYHNYCGGNFYGIIQNLDYISNLGFDAIWISPVQENKFQHSYHGYHVSNFYKINEKFGKEEGLKALVEACH
jgi:alpha-amylase